MTNFKIITLKPNRERSIRNKHPWIFSGAIIPNKQSVSNGEIVAIETKEGERLAYGFYTTESQIICKLFEFTSEMEPNFDKAYWKKKIEKAVLLRQELIDFETTNTYRVIHAEGDFLPGLIADVYNNVLVIQFLTKGISKLSNMIREIFTELGFESIYVKVKPAKNIENKTTASYWLTEPCDLSVQVKENNVLFHVDIENGQKTGFFVDQRNNRAIVQAYSKDKTVLNCFSYNGGFSMYALKGGAKKVVSVDISAPAIAECTENVVLNSLENHEGVVADCFDYLRKMPTDYFDMIVLDPPAFAKHSKAVDKAAQGYKDINLQAFKAIKKGGLVFTFSCSQNISTDLFQKIVFAAAADSGRNVQIIKRLEQGEDHPINIYHPEGDYLKGLMVKVD